MADPREKSKITAEEILVYYLEYSTSLFDEFKAFLERSLSKCLKDSLTFKTINYTLNQWSNVNKRQCTYDDLLELFMFSDNHHRPRRWFRADN
ncbi:hypothetical protein BIY22_03595 [Vibrio panuliri]|uniref:Uncharacterized protein n=1 Tax=Vibrio panuliri TaxID=1381081 RepID=A0A1Q9HIG0_9VIBR|nr:hypothetical protein BIY22_03595 [Vibrio panuliri]